MESLLSVDIQDHCSNSFHPNCLSQPTVAATKLEHDHPPTLNQRKKEHQHKSSYLHVPTFWMPL